MGFTSQVYKNEIIIDESTSFEKIFSSEECSRGLCLPFRTTPYGQMKYASAFPEHLLVPMGDLEAIIKEQEEKKERLSDLIRQLNFPHKDQSQTNYCWINAPVHTLEINFLKQNGTATELSSAYAGGIIKGWRNVGGWGEEGIRFLAEHGTVPMTIQGNAEINRSKATPANAEIAKKYRVKDWWELKPRNVHQMASLLVRGWCGAVGYNWWGHEVTAVEMVWLDGTLALRIRNSWRGWGDFGFGILQGNRMLADDIVAPNTSTLN